MSQLSDYLQYQIQLQNANDTKMPLCNQQQQKKKEKKPSKACHNWKTPKQHKDDRYKFFTMPSEFPTGRERDQWKLIKFKAFFQNSNQKYSFL
ncbi:unnamed protein product [Paramecium sonneborni]|uniref:Uncharacterized protein n=1 Tax=Paramecium sonneborni TaxID=65129 RepID=A0A8S1PAY4_9CILI|nr:unnamed protein product [Paramecium sonneborni]